MELVQCQLCDVYYFHPDDCTAGYGKCDRCFQDLWDAQMIDVEEWYQDQQQKIKRITMI